MSERRWSVLDLPETDRPRERLARLGPEVLSDRELLACLLGRGIAGESVLDQAQRLLATFGSIQGILEASVEQLSGVRGIGPLKAVQLKASVELARRMDSSAALARPCIDGNSAACRALQAQLRDKKKEHFMALLLDTRHQIIRACTIAVGSLNATVVHPRELFREAIQACAAAVIVGHNHPSGDPAPSEADIALTRRLIEAGRLLGIEVLDHIIVGSQGNVSLREKGYWESDRYLSPQHRSDRP